VKSLTVLEHLVSFLACHEEVCITLKWRGRNHGIFHNYSSAEPGETILEVYTDSVWASDRLTQVSILRYDVCGWMLVILLIEDTETGVIEQF
jgi:hypothetical protein